MIDVRRIRILREVAIAGTVSGAARAIGYTPSAVSQQLTALERETGAELLVRRGRNVELTAEGRLLVEVAERIGGELEAAEAELAARAAEPGGVVRLLAFATALQTLVPRAVAALAHAAPRLELEIDEADPDDALRLLAQQRADVVVAHDYDLLERRRHASVHRRELLEDDLRVVGELGGRGAGADGAGAGGHGAGGHGAGGHGAGGRGAGGRGAGADGAGADGAGAGGRGAGGRGAAASARGAVRLDALAARAWVLPDRGSACDRVVERACAAAGFAPRVVARSSDFGAIAALAQACGAVALVPELALERGVPSGPPAAPSSPRATPAATLSATRPLAVPVRRRIFAAVRAGAQRRPLEAAVLDALSDAAAT